jgi:asparagine synthetase B (glutamine-hydrolysing)
MGYRPPTTKMRDRLQQRGPDHFLEHYFEVSLKEARASGHKLYISIASSVLALRGTEVVAQPIFYDGTQTFLCWNGEAYRVDEQEVIGNDAQYISALLDQESRERDEACAHSRLIYDAIRGPFAMVFYDSLHGKLYFGRDYLGRRSLGIVQYPNGDLVISSVADLFDGQAWREVDTPAIYYIDLQKQVNSTGAFETTWIPFVPEEAQIADERLVRH